MKVKLCNECGKLKVKISFNIAHCVCVKVIPLNADKGIVEKILDRKRPEFDYTKLVLEHTKSF